MTLTSARFSAACLAALCLAGCAIDTTPDAGIGLHQAMRERPNAVVADDTLAEFYRAHMQHDWWQTYGDPKLDALVKRALEHNTDLKQAALNVNKALYQANILGANLVPDVNANLGVSQSRNLQTGNNAPKSYSSQLGLSYELDLWRRLNAAASAQIWVQRATAEDLAATRLAVINNVVDGYFHIAYLNRAIRLQEQAVGNYQNILRIAESRHRHGKVSANEPVQARQALLSAQDQLRQLQENRHAARSILAQIFNSDPEQNGSFGPDPEHFQLPEIKNGGPNLDIPITALTHRPDLLAAEARLQAALKNQTAQYRSWYPRITLNAALSHSANRAANLFEVPVLGGGIGISLPFLNWPTLRWQNRIAETEFEQAKLAFEKALLTGLHEVHNQYRLYRHSLQQQENAREALRLARENSRYHQVRYQHGRSSLRDWLQALNSEYAAEHSLLQARYTTLKHEAMIYKAMGGRYQTATPPAR
ncbi:efflux transporter outer membrane subunit [Neisseria shayeganii]|uniref:NodT family efflux transporter n=1 Tax=Neisseria shayeganii 871 TaxID=1032488 RepID=G4CEP1_9NEIS|nr:TolC family protein [Neisseria shayeganii]EGY53693.1 NodT family efflux transporter [Neisseria shayeganii 871]